MDCTCVRHNDVPGTSKLFSDLTHHFDRVSDLYPFEPNNIESLIASSRFDFPDSRRAALVAALTPLNTGNPSLAKLALAGTVAVVTGQQVGLFSGPAYTVYKALSAIKAASELNERGVPAVPVFWLATEDHDFAEVDHVWVFDAENRPRRITAITNDVDGTVPVGAIAISDFPVDDLRSALAGLPFADEAVALVEAACTPGQTMGSAFARLIKTLFADYNLLLIDPMDPAIRTIAAPLVADAVRRMPELVAALIARSKELVARGYHAQVLVDPATSLVFLLQDGQRFTLRRSGDDFLAPHLKLSGEELAAQAQHLSPNALLRPVVQDYILPTAAYIGGAAELAYFAQSQVLYERLLGRQPVAFPRAGFTLLDERSAKRMKRYGLRVSDLFRRHDLVHDSIAASLVPANLRARIDKSQMDISTALRALDAELKTFDSSLAAALETSRRKIEYQIGKISRKTARQIMNRDQQATRDAASLSGFVFPENHLQERLYSIIPFIARFGPGLIADLYSAIRTECADHQLAIL